MNMHVFSKLNTDVASKHWNEQGCSEDFLREYERWEFLRVWPCKIEQDVRPLLCEFA